MERTVPFFSSVLSTILFRPRSVCPTQTNKSLATNHTCPSLVIKCDCVKSHPIAKRIFFYSNCTHTSSKPNFFHVVVFPVRSSTPMMLCALIKHCPEKLHSDFLLKPVLIIREVFNGYLSSQGLGNPRYSIQSGTCPLTWLCIPL